MTVDSLLFVRFHLSP